MQCIARFGSVSPISVLMVADDGTFSGTSEAVYLIQTLKGQLKAPVNSVPCQQFYTGYLLGQKVVLAISGEKHPSLPIAPGRPCCFAPPLERPCRDVSAATCNPPKAHASSLQCNSKPESARPPKALSLRAGVLDKSATRLLQYLEKHIMHLHTNCGVLIAGVAPDAATNHLHRTLWSAIRLKAHRRIVPAPCSHPRGSSHICNTNVQADCAHCRHRA